MNRSREREKPPPSRAAASPAVPRVMEGLSFHEARARLDSSMQRVIELQRKRRELARKRRA